MIARLHTPLSFKELLKRTFKEAWADDILSLAAQQAYYFVFALFPALLTLISIASFFPVANLVDEAVTMLGRFAPPEVLTIIADQLKQISQSDQGGVLTLAFLLTIWSSSGAMVSIITTLNAAYDITEGRPFWKVRLTAIGLTIGMSIFVLLSIALVLVGPTLAEHLADILHLGAAFKWTWWIVQWPVVFLLVVTGIGLVYYFAPDAKQDWIWITPGSILATVLWVLVSLAFKAYLSYFGSYNETYGTLGAFIVVLTWFYLSGVAILVGAEMNAEIEHASPYGKAPGEKVPGEKKMIGPAAERDYEERKAKGEIPIRPFPDEVNCDVDRRAPSRDDRLRLSDAIVAAAVLTPAAVKAAKQIRDKVAADKPEGGGDGRAYLGFHASGRNVPDVPQ
jgi:membrane protein